ncbi:hypothetical protein DSO57_1016665 [Entomophthora muscae]|uniref:Uncharacterized protein n=1 Tax=Entomophthora muscae TaxID=34485 RepID=A0ACC2TFJ6_9FUNG|nr:hypothetical protein DSO57_1016665 [Entomophthora muscae]
MMSSLSSSACLLSSYKSLPYAQGKVDLHTTGMTNSNDPMLLGRTSYWKANSNFTDYFLNFSAKALTLAKNNCKLSHCGLEMFYHWEGGIPVTEAMSCFENQLCTITVKWDGKFWRSQMSKKGIKSPSFQIPHWETTNYAYTNPKKIEFTHSFNGPKTKTVYFNKVKPIIRARQKQLVFISKTPIYFWLQYTKLFHMHGIFGLSSDQMSDGR